MLFDHFDIAHTYKSQIRILRFTYFDFINPFLSDGSPKNRQNTHKKHDHLNKQQAVANQIPIQVEQKLETLLI